MSTFMIIALIVVAVLVLALVWIIGIYNSLIRLKNLVDEGWSGIDIQLKRRYDLIPNLVATVKQYGIHEQSIFEKIAAMRAAAINAQGVEARAQAESGLTSTLKTLFAVAENYPTLKANENFLALQKELSNIEHEVQLARRYYNGAARNYNTTAASFPSNIIARQAGFQTVPYFELTTSAERENPRVQF